MRALIVANDPVSAKLIDAPLKSESIISEPAETGEDAIDLVKHYDFGVVVLDFQLSDMEAPEVVRRLRSAKIHTPVLILSGSNEIEDKVRSLAAGAENAIRDARVFLACLSRHSVAKEGQVQTEFRTALSVYSERPHGSIYFIPALVMASDGVVGPDARAAFDQAPGQI